MLAVHRDTTRLLRRQTADEVVGILLFWILSAVFITRYERAVFDGLPLLLSAMNLNWFDSVLVFWSLLSRTLLVTLPLVAWNAWSLFSNGQKQLRAVAWFVHFCLLAWIVIDVKTMRITGANVSYYLEKSITLGNWQWCDNYSAIGEPIARVVLTNMLCVIGLYIGHRRITHLRRIRAEKCFDKKMLGGLIGLASILILGVFPIRGFVAQPLSLERLYATMTLPMGLFDPDTVHQPDSIAFGVGHDNHFREACEDLLTLRQVAHEVDESQLPVPEIQPHVVVIITESLQYNSLSRSDRMPLLGKWAQQGIMSQSHYCNSNCSPLGTFALLYGQLPLAYEATLKSNISPTTNRLFKSMGYQTNLIASCSFEFGQMNEFLNSSTFDHLSLHVEAAMPWYTRDQQSLEEVAERIKTADQPQFVAVYLMSTHYGYQYPPEYDITPPVNIPIRPASEESSDILNNRYAKASAFLDREIQKLIHELDMSRTILVVTGDHGESIYDDGFLGHGTRLSQYQSGTPLVICGYGIPRMQLNKPSGHVDVLPTLLHAIQGKEMTLPALHGRSLLKQNRPQGQWLVQSQPDSWEVHFVDGAGSLGLKIPRYQGEYRLLGLYDSNGQPELDKQHTSSDVEVWRRKIVNRLHGMKSPQVATRHTLEEPTQGTVLR